MSDYLGLDRPQFIAGGNISPCTIVQLSTAADFTVLASNATGISMAVAQEGTLNAPITGGSTLAANTGSPELKVYLAGDTALVVLGANVTRGSLIVADANAAGIPTLSYNSSTPQYVIGYALRSGLTNEKIEVFIQPHTY